MEKNENVTKEKSKFRCLICQSDNVNKIYSDYPGYVEGTSFDIMKCDDCNTQFILAPSTPDKLYNAIYNLESVPGYDRYKKYAKSILIEKEPLKFLSEQEFAYYAVYTYLKKRKVKSILEVGSGLGYFTYALNKEGYQTLGIDISKVSIKKSIELFGPYYKLISLEKLSKQTQQKFDLIIMTEVIEHIDSPREFISACLPLLNQNGVILLTTPYYYNVNKIWETDLPPVHRFWFSEKSFIYLSRNFGLETSFIFPDKGCCRNLNLFIEYIVSKLRSNKLPKSTLTSDMKYVFRTNYNRPSIFKRVIKNAISRPVKYFSNGLYFKFIHEQPKRFIHEQPKSFAIILKCKY